MGEAKKCSFESSSICLPQYKHFYFVIFVILFFGKEIYFQFVDDKAGEKSSKKIKCLSDKCIERKKKNKVLENLQ